MGVKLAFDPLVPYIESRYAEGSHGRTQQAVGVIGMAAVLTGTDRQVLWRWSRDGLTLPAADRMATALGLHPVHLWPEHWCANVDLDDDDDLSDLRRHGTHGAIKWHRGNKRFPLRSCEPCVEFKAEYERQWRLDHPDLERARIARRVAKLGPEGIAERDRRHRLSRTPEQAERDRVAAAAYKREYRKRIRDGMVTA